MQNENFLKSTSTSFITFCLNRLIGVPSWIDLFQELCLVYSINPEKVEEKSLNPEIVGMLFKWHYRCG